MDGRVTNTLSAPGFGHIEARKRGRIGELLCGYLLASRCGVEVVHVDFQGVDILANDPVFGVVRIECKSAHKLTQSRPGIGKPYLHFAVSSGSKKRVPICPDRVDVVALVDVLGERVIFKPVASLQKKLSLKLRPEHFEKPDLEASSWQETLRVISSL